VQSVDVAIKKVEAAGGKVVTPKTPIPGMGAYARITDTEGNVLGLFEGQ
jgi:predicted enzyme related to lactoylglutathione lyase